MRATTLGEDFPCDLRGAPRSVKGRCLSAFSFSPYGVRCLRCPKQEASQTQRGRLRANACIRRCFKCPASYRVLAGLRECVGLAAPAQFSDELAFLKTRSD
jgi:hypothetical protein